MEDGVVPVVAPLSFDPVGGTLLNTNVDTMAGKVASSLAWEGCDVSLVYCFEKKGVLSDPDDDDSVIRRITPSSFETLKDDGTVSGGMIPKIQNAIDELEYADGLSCSELVYMLTNSDLDRHKSLVDVYTKYMDMASIAASSRTTYGDHFKCLSAYVGDGFMLERVNHLTVVGFNRFMLDNGYSPNTRRDRLVFLNQLLNFAKRCGYAVPQMDPFSGFELPSPEVRQSWLTVDDVRRIRDAECKRKNVQICRDCFMLSYYLGGINIVDLLSVDFDECRRTIRYERTKTRNKPKLNKYVEFTIPDEAKPIIGKYKGRDGRLFFGDYKNRSRLHNVFDRYMGQLGEIAGVKHLIYYSARKSFAQHAFQLGVSESVVDFILGHRVDKVSTSLYSYISVTPKQASDAVRLVCDNLMGEILAVPK
jgi:site-specific recombinase XerD